VNVVPHAPGAAGPIADEFFASDEVRAINLIGGVKTARVLAERAGRTLKRTILELGGYNPMIVLDDVDADYREQRSRGRDMPCGPGEWPARGSGRPSSGRCGSPP